MIMPFSSLPRKLSVSVWITTAFSLRLLTKFSRRFIFLKRNETARNLLAADGTVPTHPHPAPGQAPTRPAAQHGGDQ
jgi:hypothetical protein